MGSGRVRMGSRKNRACVRECRTFSATARRDIFANSKKAEKQKSNNERAKQGQRVFEVGCQISYVSPTGRKNPNRPSSYPVNDGIDWSGIVFPTPVKQIDRLEAQNKDLAINVFGWENDCVIVHRISQKEKCVPRINLMLIESGEKQHYCFVKRVSALLYDHSKHRDTKHYCMLCLTGCSREDLLENHKKYCNGLNGRPTRIEKMVAFQNHYKQMKVPYVLYVDFEALVRKIPLCGLEDENKEKSYTVKTEHHEASGYSYTVVRSGG